MEMSNEWPQRTVHELQQDGILLVEDGNHGENRPRPDEFGEGEVSFIRAADMADGRVLFDTAQRINETAVRRIRKGIGYAGDILLSHKGTVGKVAFVPSECPPFVCSPQTTFWRTLDQNKIDRRFLYAFLCSLDFRKQLDARANETDMAGYVSLTAQRTFEVPLPPIDVQRFIGRILGSLDDKIELNRRMNATLESMAQAIFKSWFIDFDPVHRNAARRAGSAPCATKTTAPFNDVDNLFPDSFVESALGMVPVDWTVSELGKLCHVKRGSSPRPINDFMGGTMPWIKIADATASENPFIYETKEYIKVEGVCKSILLRVGDLILSNSATCGVPKFLALEGCIHDGWLFFPELEKITKEYLFFVLTQMACHLNQIADGTVQKNLNTKLVASQQVLIPSERVVLAFTELSKCLFTEMYELGIGIHRLTVARDMLIPQLLSGEIAISNSHISAKEVMI